MATYTPRKTRLHSMHEKRSLRLLYNTSKHDVTLVGSDGVAVTTDRTTASEGSQAFAALLSPVFAPEQDTIKIQNYTHRTIKNVLYYIFMGYLHKTIISPVEECRKRALEHSNEGSKEQGEILNKTNFIELMHVFRFAEQYLMTKLKLLVANRLNDVLVECPEAPFVLSDYMHSTMLAYDWDLRNITLMQEAESPNNTVRGDTVIDIPNYDSTGNNTEHDTIPVTWCQIYMRKWISPANFGKVEEFVTPLCKPAFEEILRDPGINLSEAHLLDLLWQWTSANTSNSFNETTNRADYTHELIKHIDLEKVEPRKLQSYEHDFPMFIPEFVLLQAYRRQAITLSDKYSHLYALPRGWRTWVDEHDRPFFLKLKVSPAYKHLNGVYKRVDEHTYMANLQHTTGFYGGERPYHRNIYISKRYLFDHNVSNTVMANWYIGYKEANQHTACTEYELKAPAHDVDEMAPPPFIDWVDLAENNVEVKLLYHFDKGERQFPLSEQIGPL